jgi:hypothetical protein
VEVFSKDEEVFSKDEAHDGTWGSQAADELLVFVSARCRRPE